MFCVCVCLFFCCVAIFLDYSAFGRGAGPRTTFGEKNKVFKEQAPPPPPSRLLQETGTQETPWGGKGAAASSSSHDPASVGHRSVASSLLTSLLCHLSTSCHLLGIKRVGANSIASCYSLEPGRSEPTRWPEGKAAGRPSVDLPAC